jgi:ferrous iron transport protein B
MLLMFQAVFLVAEPASAVIDGLNGLAGDAIAAVVPPGMLQSLLMTGVLGGVGSVVVFLPQIFVLFFFIAVLEDCGYMARAAFLMDRLMAQVGLSGKSFIPLLSSFACAVPGIMATRVIEDRRNRLVTILIAPLMSCSARLPVYTLLIGAFVPNRTVRLGGLAIPWLHALVMLAMYSVGIVAAVGVAWLLRRTLLRGQSPPFVMELPSYKLPGAKVVLLRMLEQGWAFVYRAGTLILAVAIVVWALGYFPHDPQQIDPQLRAAQEQLAQRLTSLPPGTDDAALVAEQAALENRLAAEYLATSYLGRMGRWLEPAVRPLGWDWRIGCAVIASFPAREVVIATLGVVYNLGQGQDESSEALQQTLRSATWEGTDQPVFTLPTALSLMVFFALCAQCSSTLAVIRRETGAWVWPLFTFVYMTGLAYLAALATYQLGRLCLPW